MGGLFSGSSAAVCSVGEPRIDADGDALLDAFDSTFPICDVTDVEAALLCANNGQSGGTATADTSDLRTGFVVDCAGSSHIKDCVFTANDSCAPAVVSCDRDFSCTAAAAVVGDQTGTLSRFSPTCPLGVAGPDDIWSFTAPHEQLFFFETPGMSTLVSVSGDCTSPTPLDCDNSQDGVAVVLEEGQTVIVVVAAHASGPFPPLDYVLRIR